VTSQRLVAISLNRNGRTASPWKKFDKQYQEEQQQQQQQQPSYASRVLTHRFGQRKDHPTTIISSSPAAGATKGQGRGKITIKPTRPVTPKLTIGKSRTPPNNTNKPAVNRKKQKTTIEKGVKSAKIETGKGGKANIVPSRCTRWNNRHMKQASYWWCQCYKG